MRLIKTVIRYTFEAYCIFCKSEQTLDVDAKDLKEMPDVVLCKCTKCGYVAQIKTSELAALVNDSEK